MQSIVIRELETPAPAASRAVMQLQMKKVRLPDCAEVNSTPPPPHPRSGSEHNCLIFRMKEDRKCLSSPSSLLLCCPGSFLAQGIKGPALTLWALAGGEVDRLSLLEGLGL